MGKILLFNFLQKSSTKHADVSNIEQREYNKHITYIYQPYTGKVASLTKYFSLKTTRKDTAMKSELPIDVPLHCVEKSNLKLKTIMLHSI